MAQVALAQPPRNLPGPVVPCTYFCPNDWTSGGDQVVTFDEPFEENAGADQVTVVYWAPLDQVASTVAQARARLAADGWDVGEPNVQAGGVAFFTASKADLSVDLVATRDATLPSVFLRVERDLPAVVPVAGVAGLIGGLLVGWMLAAWVLQRHRRHQVLVRVATVLWGLPTLVLMFLVEALTANFLLALGLGRPDLPLAALPLLPAFAVSGFVFAPMIALVIGAVVLVNLLLAALPTRPAHVPGPPTDATSPVVDK